MLANLRIASPCSADWDRMIGDERVRYCPECKLNVYNFSATPEGEIRRLVENREGRLCARWYRRTDGTMLTADCPAGFRARVRKISLVAGTALSAFMGVGTAKAQQVGTASSPSTSPSLVQIDRARQGEGMIWVQLVDASGAVIPNARISIVNPAGNVVAQGGTDFKGEFKVLGLQNSSYTVQAKSFGFKRIEIKDVMPSMNTNPAANDGRGGLDNGCRSYSGLRTPPDTRRSRRTKLAPSCANTSPQAEFLTSIIFKIFKQHKIVS